MRCRLKGKTVIPDPHFRIPAIYSTTPTSTGALHVERVQVATGQLVDVSFVLVQVKERQI